MVNVVIKHSTVHCKKKVSDFPVLNRDANNQINNLNIPGQGEFG
jgi:hypothetical protein